MVLNLGQRQVILGMPWLQKWNPQIDWLAKTLTIPQGINWKDIVPLHESLPSEVESIIPQRYLLCWLGMDVDLKTTQRLRKREQWLARETIGRSPFLPKLPKKCQSKKLCSQNGVTTSPMCSQKKPMTNFPHINPMTIPLISNRPLPRKLPKSTP